MKLKNKLFLKFLLFKFNKNQPLKVANQIDCQFDLSTSNAVIDLISILKDSSNLKSGNINPLSHDDLYTRFVNYIIANKNGHKLPRSVDIEKELRITKPKRLELCKQALNNNILSKCKNYYQLKIDEHNNFFNNS